MTRPISIKERKITTRSITTWRNIMIRMQVTRNTSVPYPEITRKLPTLSPCDLSRDAKQILYRNINPNDYQLMLSTPNNRTDNSRRMNG